MTLCGLLCNRRRKKGNSETSKDSNRQPARGTISISSNKPTCAFCNNLLPRERDRAHHAEYELTPEQLGSEAVASCDFCSFIRAATDHVCSLNPQDRLSIVKVTAKRLKVAETIPEYRERRYKQLEELNHSVDPCQIPLPESTSSRRTSVESSYAHHTDQRLPDHEAWQNPSRLTITFRYEEHGDKTFDVFLKGPNDRFSWMLLEPGPPLRLDSTGSTRAADFLQFITSRCLESHQSCQPLSSHERWADKTMIPKRILDISRHSKIRVVEKFPLDKKYACLSHCWGGHRALTTELNTLADRKANIKWSDIPKTFQEAILFAKQLALQYIWIDSLCIIQDDENDWLEESSKMASIYTNSYVTIAAMRAKDAHQGLFTLTDTTFRWQASDFVLHRSPQHLSVGRPEANLFPLVMRAWVAQEIMLSPRIIYFCDGEIVYECMEEWKCTCMSPDVAGLFHILKYHIFNPRASKEDPEPTVEEKENSLIALLGLPREAVDGALNFFLGENRDKPPSEDPTPHHLGVWRDVVRYYSKLQLTFNEDRLPAISGLARRLTERYGCVYAAGLWLEDLTRSLTWSAYTGYMGEELPPATQCTGSTAPSWSWASVMGEVVFAGPIGYAVKEYYSLVSCECEPVSHFDPFGRLRSARLTLEGRLLLIRVSDRNWTFEDKNVASGTHLDPGQEYSESIPLFGMPICSALSSKNDENPGAPMHCHGLLLQQSADDDTYYRVGTWENSAAFEDSWGQRFWTAQKLDEKLNDLEMKIVTLV